MSQASEYQPDPQPGQTVVVDVVLADIRERAETGKRKYGTYLETNNKRSATWDLYQELVDAVMYIRQELLEEELNGGGWKYLAGLVDGEGCISVNYDKTHTFLRATLEITMTDRQALDWACAFTKCGKVYERKDKRENRRVPYKWMVSDAQQSAEILKEILPYLKIKKAEALAFIVLASLRLCKTNGKRDFPEIEDKVYDIIKKLKKRDIPEKEAIDLAIYLRQRLLEEENKTLYTDKDKNENSLAFTRSDC
jgi:hypothetical protein